MWKGLGPCGVGTDASTPGQTSHRSVFLWLMSVMLAFYPAHSQAAEIVVPTAGTREFSVKGVVKKVEPENGRMIVAHDAIPDFMDAMTMPFRVKDPGELT